MTDHNELYDQVQQLSAQLRVLKSEVAITRQHLREIQQWQDTTQAYIVVPQMQTDREAWDEMMREGMV
jgi:prefoldin subunit 5